MKELENKNELYLKKFFVNNLQDYAQLPRVILILINSKEHPDFQVQLVLKQLEKEFPTYQRKAILFNSENGVGENLWTNFISKKYFLPESQDKQVGCPLQRSDIILINETISDIIQKSFLPSIENKISLLDASITLNKKGLKNAVKNFWKKMDKAETTDNYQLTSVEVYQLHQADILFLVEEYDQAYQLYRSVAYDFKNKSNKHYGYSMEMMLYSQILNRVQLSKREVDIIFDQFFEIFHCYQKQVSTKVFSARLLIMIIHCFNIFQRYSREYLKFLQDASNTLKDQFTLIHPLFQEQFSLLSLQMVPQFERKQKLSLILAGFKYHQFGFTRHAINCYLKVLPLYERINWPFLSEYVYETLGSYYSEIGEFINSLYFYKKAINSAKSVSIEQKQLNLVNEIGKLCLHLDTLKMNQQISEQQFGAVFSGENQVELPQIDPDSVDILVKNEEFSLINNRKLDYLNTYHNKPLIRDLNSDTIKTWGFLLEKINQMADFPDLSTFADSAQEKNSVKVFDCQFLQQKNHIFAKKERQCYAGESLYLILLFENPMYLKLDLKKITPVFEFTPLEANQIPLNPSNSYKNDSLVTSQNDLINTGDNNPLYQDHKDNTQLTNTVLQYDQIDFQLNPSQSKQKILIKMHALQPGKLKILGIKWKMFHLRTEFQFTMRGKPSKNGYEQNLKNVLNVLPPTSELKHIVENYDENMFLGQLKRFQITFSAKGPQKIEKIAISTSHPHLFGFEAKVLENLQLDSNETTTVDFTIRSFVKERGNIKLLIKYVCSGNIQKLTRILLPIQIQNSFNIIPQSEQCSSQFLLNLQFDNFLSSQLKTSQKNSQVYDLLESDQSDDIYNLHLKNVTVLSNNWIFTDSSLNQQLDKQIQEKNAINLFLNQQPSTVYTENLLEADEEKFQSILKQQRKNFNDSYQNHPFYFNINQDQFQFIINDKKHNAIHTKNEESLISTDLETILNLLLQENKHLIRQQQSIDPEMNIDNLIFLILSWYFYNEQGQKIEGYHFLQHINMNQVPCKLPSQNINKFDFFPLKIIIKAPSQIDHNFQNKRFLEVDLEVQIKNCFSNGKLNFSFQAVNSDDILKSSHDINYPFFIWDQKQVFIIKDMKANDQCLIKLRVIFFQYGLYDISRFKYVFFEEHEEEKDRKTFYSHSLNQQFFVDVRERTCNDNDNLL